MNIKSISKRTLAYMILKVSATLGGGFVVGVEVWQAAAVAAFVGFMEVAEEVKKFSDDKKGMAAAKKAATTSGKKMMDSRKGAMMSYLKK